MTGLYSDRLHLILGYACNHKCRYCVQEIHGRPAGFGKQLSQNTLFIIQDRARKISPRPLKITFFGGEPLLYGKALKEILENVTEPNIRWKIHTNGALLTRDFVTLFNKHRVHVGLSHDGPAVIQTRGVDVLQSPEIIGLFNDIRDRAVDFVVTSYTQDFYALRNYFCEKFQRDDWRLKPAFLVNPSEVPADMLQWNFSAWQSTSQQMMRNAFEQLIRHNCDPRQWESAFVTRVIGDYFHPIAESPYIRLNERCLVPHIDLSGRLSFCERLEAVLLHLDRTNGENWNSAVIRLTDQLHRNCPNCAVFDFCRGQCPVASPRGATSQCKLLNIFYSEVSHLIDRLAETHPEILRNIIKNHFSEEHIRRVASGKHSSEKQTLLKAFNALSDLRKEYRQ